MLACRGSEFRNPHGKAEFVCECGFGTAACISVDLFGLNARLLVAVAGIRIRFTCVNQPTFMQMSYL